MLSVDTDEKEVFTVDFVWSSLHRSNLKILNAPVQFPRELAFRLGSSDIG